MLPALRTALFVVGSLLLTAVALSQARRAILPVSEIRPGMRGYGMTVFRGVTPERFEVEVIDVLHKFRPDQDLILVRTEHPILEKAIAVGGMSGSPIYIDGKMIGAYAYGWTFGKEPVAGVTPIENMLAEIARPVDPRVWKALGTFPAQSRAIERGAPRAAAGRQIRSYPSLAAGATGERVGAFSALRAQAAQLAPRTDSTAYGSPVQVATPLLLSGMTDVAIAALGKELAPFGLDAMQAGAGSAAPRGAAAPRFVDGGSIGVQLVRGDLQVTATGTVTYVEGQRLLGFGHPMLNAGQVGLPTCTSKVVHVLTSQMRSFKLAESISPLGTLVHDRQAAIVVDQSRPAPMLPMTVRVNGVAAPRTRWDLELANHRLLTPGLAFSAVLNALSATAVDRADVMFRARTKISIDGHGTIETEDLGYTPFGAADAGTLAGIRMFSLMSIAYDNPFEDTTVSKLEVDLDVRFGREVTTILDARVASDVVDPGKDVHVYVTLRRFDESERTEIVTVAIPKSAAGDSVELVVEPGDQVRVEQPKPDSLDDLLNAVKVGYPATSLVVSAKLPQQGVKLRGALINSLPGSALDTLQPTNESERPAIISTYQRQELAGREILTGSAKIKINVREEPLR
jgi:hypothetical protein